MGQIHEVRETAKEMGYRVVGGPAIRAGGVTEGGPTGYRVVLELGQLEGVAIRTLLGA